MSLSAQHHFNGAKQKVAQSYSQYDSDEQIRIEGHHNQHHNVSHAGVHNVHECLQNKMQQPGQKRSS